MPTQSRKRLFHILDHNGGEARFAVDLSKAKKVALDKAIGNPLRGREPRRWTIGRLHEFAATSAKADGKEQAFG